MNILPTEPEVILNLTENETRFFKQFLALNGCGATSPKDLLEDNYSCQCIEEIFDCTDYTHKEIGGYLSSLQTKNVLWLDERDGPYCKNNKWDFEPDLYWISDITLAELTEKHPTWTFTEETI